MKTGFLAIVLPLAMLATGCQYKQRVNQDLWERELRLQEDCIDRLKWQLEDSQYALAEANRKIEALTKEVGVLRDTGGSEPSVPHSILGPTEDGGEAPRVPPAPRLPMVDPGVPFTPGETGTSIESTEETLPEPNRSAVRVSPISHMSADRPVPPVERLNPDAEIDRIVIDHVRSGGLSTDGVRGDEMLSVAIEQFDATGRRVQAPGDVTIVVVDPALEGDSGRIARWQFEAEDVERHVRRNREGGAICYELPWPTAPQHRNLRLFVRFATYDGRRLDADLPIEVELTNDDASNSDEDVKSDDKSPENRRDPGKTARRPAWSPYR